MSRSRDLSACRNLLLSAAAFVLAVPAFAQDAPSDTSAATSLDDIVVTARRRAETIQTTPASVIAFSAATLEADRIRSFDDIAQRLPGVAMNPDNILEPNIFMRGVGTDIESAASSAAIGFFANDVYLSRAQGSAMEIYDLERVEVVRGPQGTLYGKNVVGGAINYVIARPQKEFAANGEVSVGNYNSFEGRGMVNGAIAKGLSARVSFSGRVRDGFAQNTFTGNDAESLNAFGVRGQLRYQPDDTLDILLSADKTRRRDGAAWVDMLDPSEHNAPLRNPDRRAGPNNIDGHANADIEGIDLHIDWKAGPGTLSSITAYRTADFDYLNNDAGSFVDFTAFTYDDNGRIDLDALTPEQVAAMNDDYYVNAKTENLKTFSQELRYSTALEGHFQLMGGLFYMHEDVTRLEDANYIFVLYNNNGGESALTTTKTNTWAAFAEATFDFGNNMMLTTGLRYTRDKKDFTVARGVVHDNLGAPFEDDAGNYVTSFTASDSRSFGAWTPQATLNWKATPEAFLYATVSRGYKSGGWNGENATSPGEARAGYEPEFAWNYEIGAKTEWLDRKLRANITGFWTNYTNMQTQQYVQFDPNLPPDNVIANAGSARVRGIEAELLAIPVKGLTLGANYAFMDGRITGDLLSTELNYDWMCDCMVTVETNLKGNVLRRTPRNAFTLSAAYEGPLSATLDGFIRADYNWSDGYFFENENDPRTYVDAHGVVNGSLGLSANEGRLQLTLWAKNIANSLYVTGKSDNIGTVLAGYGPPRTVGVALRWAY